MGPPRPFPWSSLCHLMKMSQNPSRDIAAGFLLIFADKKTEVEGSYANLIDGQETQTPVPNPRFSPPNSPTLYCSSGNLCF